MFIEHLVLLITLYDSVLIEQSLFYSSLKYDSGLAELSVANAGVPSCGSGLTELSLTNAGVVMTFIGRPTIH